MSILTDLEAALEGKREAAALVETRRLQSSRSCSPAFVNRRESLLAHYRLHALLTDDTIRALLDAAEAAEHEPRCPFCAEERHMAGSPTQPHLSDCPLAPLVKEADHDRA
jgi:hypothetical protein